VEREGREGWTTAVMLRAQRRVPVVSLKGCNVVSPGQSEAPPWVTVHPEIRSPVSPRACTDASANAEWADADQTRKGALLVPRPLDCFAYDANADLTLDEIEIVEGDARP